MNSSIYIDNVRGFSNCLIDLSRITLLVGENSSGKSSFLAIAHLLLTDDFWLNPSFNSFGHELGSFNDLVSKASKFRKEFTVGCVSKKSPDSQSIFGAVLTFNSKDDSPKIKRCTYIHGSKIISYHLSGDSYRWLEQEDLEDINTKFSSAELLERLVSCHSKIRSGSGKMIEKAPRSSRFFLITMSHLIGRELDSIKGYKKDIYVDFIPEGGIGGGTWFAPIRAEPRQIYEKSSEVSFSPSGQHTPYLLREVLKSRIRDKSANSASAMIEQFGKNSGLFEGLDVKSFGRTSSAPFTLSVKLNNETYHLGEVGYGVSQILPIVTEMFAGSTSINFFMQQPEVHLHPRAQAELGNILYVYSAAIEASIVVVETHSDYLIDRLRSLIRENYHNNAEKIDLSILWFERKDGINNVRQIKVDKSGEFPIEMPDGYRGFFVKETLRGLGLDADN